MGPQSTLNVVICKDAADAIAQGYSYAADPDFKPIEITKVVVVRNGTESGAATVDLVLVDESGQKFAVMLSGALLKSIPC